MRRQRNQIATDVRALAEKVRRLASEHGLTACMNDTKWREVCRSFGAWTPPPRFRISDLLAPTGYVSEWDAEWYYHPYPYVSIRWMEVELPAASLNAAVDLCRGIGAPAETTPAGIRILGWAGSEDLARVSGSPRRDE